MPHQFVLRSDPNTLCAHRKGTELWRLCHKLSSYRLLCQCRRQRRLWTAQHTPAKVESHPEKQCSGLFSLGKRCQQEKPTHGQNRQVPMEPTEHSKQNVPHSQRVHQVQHKKAFLRYDLLVCSFLHDAGRLCDSRGGFLPLNRTHILNMLIEDCPHHWMSLFDTWILHAT